MEGQKRDRKRNRNNVFLKNNPFEALAKTQEAMKQVTGGLLGRAGPGENGAKELDIKNGSSLI